MSGTRGAKIVALCVIAALGTLAAGCHQQTVYPDSCGGQLPKELNKVSLPAYVIEPPDLLLIEAVRVIPLPPYRIEPLDALLIRVDGTTADQPIAGLYVVESEGTVNLGFSYGSAYIVDMSLDEATVALTNHLKKAGLADPKVTVALGQSRARQQIRGEHLVRQDGRVSLGVYGSVPVAGLTLPQAKAVIEQHLSQFLLRPEVSVDVAAYNSKVYYIITDGAGLGKQIYRFPILGNETVLDAMSQINGTPTFAAKNRLWIARPAPDEICKDQILPIDLIAITERGSTETNYQLLPGDRIFVKGDELIRLDNTLAKIVAPMERLFGVSILGASAVRNVGGKFNNGAGGTGTGGF
jgi:polysaccharide export outer membrane protein